MSASRRPLGERFQSLVRRIDGLQQDLSPFLGENSCGAATTPSPPAVDAAPLPRILGI